MQIYKWFKSAALATALTAGMSSGAAMADGNGGRDYYYYCYDGTNYSGTTYLSPVFAAKWGKGGELANSWSDAVDRWVAQNDDKSASSPSCLQYDTRQQAQQQRDQSYASFKHGGGRVVEINFYGQ